MQSNAMMTQEQAAIEHVKTLANIVLSLRDQVFKDGLDYGLIPGTGNKPTLLLPGMEKLLRALHLRPEYVALSQIEDFDKSRIFYRYECRLVDYDTGLCVSTAIGSANSHESKWRWRAAERLCPTCGKATIIKGKEEYGGGWLCFAKKGGCGAKFKDGDSSIEAQVVGRIENPDIFDQMNTIDKIAQKRALSSAIKGAANVSEFFTVDLEDFQQFDTRALPNDAVEATFTVVEPAKSVAEPSAGVRGAGIARPSQNTEPEPPPNPLNWIDEPVALQNAPAPLSVSATGIPDDIAPNLYPVSALVVGQTGTANTYALKLKSGTFIQLSDMSVLDGLSIGEKLVVELARGTYSVEWMVQADKDGDAWNVLRIVEKVPA